jgi:hypothetical protein
MSADQVRTGVPVCLGVDQQDLVAHVRRQSVLAGEGANCSVEHDVRRDETLHDFKHVAEARCRTCVLFVVAFFVLRDVVVVLPNEVSLVVRNGLTLFVR